jgi:hypothetical protein
VKRKQEDQQTEKMDRVVAAIDAAHQKPRALPQLTQDPLAIREPLTTPTPSLDPRVIDYLEGNDSTTAGYVSCAREAFATAHAGIQHVIDARRTINAHSDLSTEQKLLKVATLVEQRQKQAAKVFDGAMERLNAGIKSYEDTLTGPLEQKAGLGTVNEEIRKHVAKLPDDKREGFIKDAIAHRDTKTLLAICGAGYFLSGLSRERHALLTRQYHELTNPDAAKRLRIMVAARNKIQTSGPLIFGQLESALGWKWQKVIQARDRAKAVADVLKLD